ncbi:LysR family transcriptional regulator [Methylobacterium trifolii]|uniref:PCP degradation transcriptional activation protein n=1 Tax=Methylobacterium trifolii TaxID=1003092 RepID=A0ABQ4TYQ3_9HYPH|nr:LysR family transcriptional regulator [Methylobacterium trifolii]GJE59987.1 PCP degradation transcriptional activation protein [Methylobacterium trifolii]
MKLRSVDLNLLVALDALLHELHVTRAAARIGLSQPAMSNALGRLRTIFRDELLVRTAAGMQATPRALELIEPTRQILRRIERVFDSDSAFDPAVAARTFNIRLSDLLGVLLLPSLVASVAVPGSAVGISVVHLSPVGTVEALEKDEIDLAVSTALVHSTSIKSEVLLHDRMVCLMRASHPAAAGTLDLDAFLSARHLKVSMSSTDLRFVDDVLVGRGLARDVALNVPHWLVVPDVLERTDLLTVMPRRLASVLARESLAIRDLPFASDAFTWSMYWHRRHEGNSAIAWLRSRIADVARSVA